MERVKSKNNPNVEWEYYFEKICTEFHVAIMYYKGRKVLELYEERNGHSTLMQDDFRFVNSYNGLFASYKDEKTICERNNKITEDGVENARNKLIAGCVLIEKRFMEIIEKVKAVI